MDPAWNLLLLILAVIASHLYAKAEEQCLRPTRVGCFEAVSPWTSILRPLPPPEQPEKINTQAHLFTRNSFKSGNEIRLWPEIKVPDDYDNEKKTYMIVHGYIDDGNKGWQEEMAHAILREIHSNVIIIDWGKGSKSVNYLQVAANIRVVAAEIIRLLENLVSRGTDPVHLHLIGHSLGAHICGYVGKAIYGIGRITGLDPAQPAFEGYDPAVRLSRNDAVFVDVLHTDARPFFPLFGFGMIGPVGDVDFYINGGFNQPGCLNMTTKTPQINSLYDLASVPFDSIYKVVACPHERSYHYFTTAISLRGKCTFWGKKTNILGTVASGSGVIFNNFFSKWFTCSKRKCSPIGLYTEEFLARGSHFVITKEKPPYCKADKESDRIMSRYNNFF